MSGERAAGGAMRPAPPPDVSAGGLRRARRRLRRAGLSPVGCSGCNGAVRLTGQLGSWDEKIRAGYIAASVRCRGVVNDITVAGLIEPGMSLPKDSDLSLVGREYDVVVIGAGVIGCATARELSRHDLRIAVIEKEDDVAVHTSSRNDGMIHPGFAPEPGTQRAWYNARGNRMYTELAAELGFKLARPGSLVLFHTGWLRLLLPVMRLRCRRNGVAGPVRYLSPREVRRIEPVITAAQRGALLFPSTGIVNPFEVTIAYAENAVRNGVEFLFETAVLAMDVSGDATGRRITTLRTNRGAIRAHAVVNAAGNWADAVADMAGDRFFTIHGRRGLDVITDKRLGSTQRLALSMPHVFAAEHTHSKGGGLIPTLDGNLLAGPTARETWERENYGTTPAEFDQILHHLSLNRAASADAVITYFAGVRPATFREDFVIGPSRAVTNLVHAAGIQSPGLASAPAIAVDVAEMVVNILACGQRVLPNPSFEPGRTPRVDLSRLTLEERARLIAVRGDYGRTVCRCEDVTEGEIRDALRTPLGVRSVDAVKRRTRAGAGRCHGGFCLPRILEVIHSETGLPMTEIRKKSGASYIVLGETKGRHASGAVRD